MGGCASTSFISWASKRVTCNCALNSEGISKAGPGSNPRGLKHRIKPPTQSDKYLLRRNSFNREEINEGPIERAVFLYDNPYSMTLSLFRRQIAMGHAMAVTGNKPNHQNTLSTFLERNEDSFGFYDQFKNWTKKDETREYPILLVDFNIMWDNLDFILGFMGIDLRHKGAFLRKNNRVDRMAELSDSEKQKLKDLYGGLDNIMNNFRGRPIII